MNTRLALALLGTCAPVLAQGQISPRQLTTPIRDAGIYHIESGTWSRSGGQTAAFGPDVIYSATSPSGYFATGFELAMTVDEGMLPGPTHPVGGPQDSYEIQGFQFSYCSSDTLVDWAFFFYDSYQPCDLPSSTSNCLNQAGGTWLLGMPAAGACWLVTIDLPDSQTFVMEADGGPCAPGYQGGTVPPLDHFGWGAIHSTPNGAPTGLILSGYDPAWATPGQGTCYDPSSGCAGGNTGLGARDMFAAEGGANGPGCYWFGGYASGAACGAPAAPGAQFYLELYTDCQPTPCTVTFCESDPNAAGDLSLDTCSLSAGSNIVTVINAGLSLFAFLNVSATTGPGFVPPGAASELCLNGTIGRYNKDLQSPGGSGTWSVDIYGGNTGQGIGALPSTVGGVLQPGETWHFQGWQRQPAGAPTRYTRGLSVTFGL